MLNDNYKDLLRIAIPATIEGLFVVFVSFMDTWMVSPLGTKAIAAVSVANQPKVFVFMLFYALGTATSITVAQTFGREDRKQANSVLAFSLKASILWSIVLAVLMTVFAEPIMVVCSNQKDTMGMSMAFLRIIMIGMIFQAVSTVMNAALRGITMMKATLYSSVTMGVVDIIFNYLLIEGHLGCPKLGVSGAAIATSIGNLAGMLVSTSFLINKDCYINISYAISNHSRVNRNDANDMYTKLANVFSENILTRIGILITGMIVARLGSYQTSIYSVGVQLMFFSYTLGDGLQASVQVLVSKTFGSGHKEECKDYIRIALRVGITSSIITSLICVIIGGWFFSLFNSGADFIDTGRMVSKFVAAIVPFQVVRIICASMIRGLGDTRKPAIVATISALVINPPVSFLCAMVLGMGQSGLWIGCVASQLTWFILESIIAYKKYNIFTQEELPVVQ